MTEKKPYFSLILPCYNEAEHIQKSADRIIKVLRLLSSKFEVIFIDDSSQDETPKLIKQIISKYPYIDLNVILHRKNIGRGATVSEGIAKARGKIVGYMDIDCEISPEYLKKFVKECKNTDILVAKRLYKFNIFAIHRFVASKLYAGIAKIMFGLPVSDTEAGFKFFNKKKITSFLSEVKDKHWFWDTEIIVVSFQKNLKIREIPVVFKRRHDKTSTVNLLPDSIKYLKSLIRLSLKLRRL